MARRFNLFNFLEKKMTNAEFAAVISKVMSETAFREMALHIAVSYIANTLSKCEIKTYEKGEEVKGKLYYLLNVSPNANENASQFMHRLIERCYYEGEALVVPHNDGLYCADGFTVDESKPLQEFVYSGVTFGSQQLKRKYKAADVFRFKLDNGDTKRLVDLLGDKYSELMGLAMESYRRTNGKKYKLILEQYRAGDAAFNEVYEKVLKKQLQTFVENNNAVYPQFKGMSLEEFSTATPTNSSDIIALRKEIFETTAQAIKIPLPMLYGNMTNIKDITGQFLTFCIDPWSDIIGEEYTRKYYSFDEWKAGSKVVVDTTRISHIDILDIATAVDKLISSGALCVDEVRGVIGYNPLNTEFSRRHFMTKNYEPAENALGRMDGAGGEAE